MGKLSGEASIEVDAPIAECWALAEDVPIAPEWQGGLDRIDVLETDDQGRAVVCNSTTDIKVRSVTTRVRFTYDGPTRLSWVQEKGDLSSVEGAWILEDLGDGRTKVTYKLDVDTGRVLGMLIRGPVEGIVRDRLVNNRPAEFAKAMEGRA